MRSDGSLMTEAFARLHPIETLLCGPASSVMGGYALTGEDNCIVVDMGGTTTDIAIIENGQPVRAPNGFCESGKAAIIVITRVMLVPISVYRIVLP